MKGREKHIFILLLMLIGFSRQNFAQEGNPLQFIPGVSQSAWSNPAFQNKDEKLVLGLPLISGTRMNWNANFALDYIFTKNFVYNLDRFSNELGGPGHELTTISIPSLYLSLRSENQNFTFSVTERIYLESTFDNEFLKFIDQGLIPYYGKTESYGPMKIHGYFYREMAFAYSLKTDGGLSIGIRPKLLFGRMNYVMDEMTINVYTDTEAAQLLIEPTGSYQLGGNFDVRNLPDGTSIRPNPEFSDYFFNFRNPGAAVDLGIDYRTGDTEISASLLDLGFFSMKNQVYDVTYSDVLRYNEEDLYQSTNSDEANYLEPKLALQQLIDSIPYVISAVPSTQNLKENIPSVQIKRGRSSASFKENGSWNFGTTHCL